MPIWYARCNAAIGLLSEGSYLYKLMDDISGPFYKDIVILNKKLIIENGYQSSNCKASLRRATY